MYECHYSVLLDTVKVSKSECVDSLGVVFRSNQCMKCSNWYLLTIPMYGIAGLLLVFLLFTLRPTLTTGSNQSGQCRNNTSKSLQVHNVWILKQHIDINEHCLSYWNKCWSRVSNMFLEMNGTAYKNRLVLTFPSISTSNCWCTNHCQPLFSDYFKPNCQIINTSSCYHCPPIFHQTLAGKCLHCTQLSTVSYTVIHTSNRCTFWN